MSTEDYAAILQLEFAVVGIKVEGDAISVIDFLPEDTPAKEAINNVTKKIAKQFVAYQADPRSFKLNIPVKVKGTEFQLRVWDALTRIPVGTALTYGELAKQLNTGARAVGNACRRNPVPLIVPCHRVVSSRGLGGFAGDRHAGWTETKRWLLSREGYTPSS